MRRCILSMVSMMCLGLGSPSLARGEREVASRGRATAARGTRTGGFVGTIGRVPARIRRLMQGRSYRRGCPVPMSKLAYLRVSYWGYDGKVRLGELVVARRVAKEVVGIFRDLFLGRFPIQRMRLVDAYGGSDDRSMADNNTSAFNCREVAGRPGVLSLHSLGTAIDINPRENPYVKNGKVYPPSGKPFVDRTQKHKGMVLSGDVCHKAFARRGWTWGGTEDWYIKRGNRDYQHFQKQAARMLVRMKRPGHRP